MNPARITSAITAASVSFLVAACTNESRTQENEPMTTKKTTHLPTLHHFNHQGISFNVVKFNSDLYELIVADQPKGPGSLWNSAKEAGSSANGLAAINAGFFTPTGDPLGIVIQDGELRGHLNHSSLGAGMYFTTNKGAEIKRSALWKSIKKQSPRHLLQTGPMLMENAEPTQGLSNKSKRVRSFLITDNKNHWAIGHSTACTLAELSSALHSSDKLCGFEIRTALNLDGGRSSDLWINSQISGNELIVRSIWNKPVRNFLVIVSKKPH